MGLVEFEVAVVAHSGFAEIQWCLLQLAVQSVGKAQRASFTALPFDRKTWFEGGTFIISKTAIVKPGIGDEGAFPELPVDIRLHHEATSFSIGHGEGFDHRSNFSIVVGQRQA